MQQRNKELVSGYMSMLMNEHEPREAVAKYLGDRYVQHNPRSTDGPEGVLSWIEPLLETTPELKYEIKRMIAEDDLVLVHGVITEDAADLGLATMEIFRIADDKVVEHWDVMMPIPAEAANSNTMF